MACTRKSSLSRVACISVLSLFVALCPLAPLFAQAFKVGGGTSTLYQAGGGSITMHARSYDVTMGAGIINGHLFEGAQLVKATPHGRYVLGDDRINFHLPTDLFDTGHFLLTRGLGVYTTRRQTDILAFAGATATQYNSPIFDGAKLNDPAGILFLSRSPSPRWQLFSDTIFSSKMTAIEAVRWEPLHKVALGVAAGTGANQPYGATSLDFSRRKIDVQAAYIAAGQQFHRVATTYPYLAEPDRENILANVRPYSFLTFTGAHQNFMVPQYPSTVNVRSAIDEGSMGLRVFNTGLNGSIYHSTYQGGSNHSVAFSATRDFTERLHLAANYLASRPRNASPTNAFITTLSETVNSRLSVNENISNSNGNTAVNFGGQLLSNFVTVNAGYETFYVPAHNSAPFEQALIVDVKMNLLGRLALHGSSFVDPNGHLRYTVDAHTTLNRGQGPPPEHVEMGRAVMRGCVIDSQQQKIEGAAILIDGKLVYTDSSGCFFLRENRPRTHTLEIVLTEFLAGGNWHVISAPATITSSPENDNIKTPIIVVLNHVRTANPTSGETIGDPSLK